VQPHEDDRPALGPTTVRDLHIDRLAGGPGDIPPGWLVTLFASGRLHERSQGGEEEKEDRQAEETERMG